MFGKDYMGWFVYVVFMRFRAFINSFRAYAWEPSDFEIAASVGLDVSRIRRFDLNTSPYKPSHWLKKVAGELEELAVHRYPDTSYSALRRGLASYLGVGEDCFVIANGGDEAFDIISKVYLEDGCEAIVSSPTYSMYRVVSEIMGAKVVSVPRKVGFLDDVDGLIKAVNNRTRLIFLCSPNNPTGNVIGRDDLVRILNECDVGVVVDEAYQEYGGESSVKLAESYSNLMVVRTFSKAFGLAGARLGYIVACRETVDALNKVRPPNSVDVVTLRLAELALDDVEWVRLRVRDTLAERSRLLSEISKIRGVRVYPSAANFFLLEFLERDRDEVYYELLRRGFVLRRLEDPALSRCLRVSVGLPEDNNALLDALRDIL
ncbi:MAG: histidinol-phosphate transaminase [Candidatus Jordarchaeales archaeon]